MVARYREEIKEEANRLALVEELSTTAIYRRLDVKKSPLRKDKVFRQKSQQVNKAYKINKLFPMKYLVLTEVPMLHRNFDRRFFVNERGLYSPPAKAPGKGFDIAVAISRSLTRRFTFPMNPQSPGRR